MDLECAICCGLLAEEPDVPGPPLPAKRPRKPAEPVAGPSTGPVAPPAPQLCVPKCGHMFHKRCLINWIRMSNSKTCPSCRKALTERTLTTVFLPAVSQEEKKCEKCEITSKTCEELATEKEQLKGLYEKEVELREGAEMEVKKGVEATDHRLTQLNKETVEIQQKFLEEERKVDQLTAEKEQFKKLFEDEVVNRNNAEIEEKKKLEVMENRINQLLKEKAEVEGRRMEEVAKVEVLEQRVVDGSRREAANNARRETLQREYRDIEMKFLQERDKVEEMQGTLNELQERHRLLIGDIEEMTKKYQTEQEKANILEGRVASLEAQLQQYQSQSDDSWSTVDSSGSFQC